MKCKTCGREIFWDGKCWDHKWGKLRHVAVPEFESEGEQTVKITRKVRIFRGQWQCPFCLKWCIGKTHTCHGSGKVDL